MLTVLTFLFNLLFNLFRSKKSLLVENSLYKKEIEILSRQKKNRLLFIHSDKIILSILNNTDHIKIKLDYSARNCFKIAKTTHQTVLDF